ncbi:MAG: 3-oxoacyl-ACP reductase family protein [Vampirovibrionales bacterium]|nr:3-oxoacyl-ACP reductase family protein [Vampirovibrionales bacterium]
MGLLDKKRVLISGGSRGLGKALCNVFAREGASVAFNYNSSDAAADDTLSLIQSHGQSGLKYKASVTDGPAVKAMADDIVAQWGGIDILVNNAAINKGDNFMTMTEAAWSEIMDVNINGLFYMTKAFFKPMMRQRKGHILNITSIAALRALPTSVHYSTSKAAVVGFTKCLSREGGPFGIQVNAIAAGLFETDLGDALPQKFRENYEAWCPMGRFGNPAELAEFAAFMVCDRNTYMTGEVVQIDGGAMV